MDNDEAEFISPNFKPHKSINLDESDARVKHIQSVIDRNKLPFKAFAATFKSGDKEYVVFDKDGPRFSSQNIETIFAKLDVEKFLSGFITDNRYVDK